MGPRQPLLSSTTIHESSFARQARSVFPTDQAPAQDLLLQRQFSPPDLNTLVADIRRNYDAEALGVSIEATEDE